MNNREALCGQNLGWLGCPFIFQIFPNPNSIKKIDLKMGLNVDLEGGHLRVEIFPNQRDHRVS